jgi:hypothetical protein
VNDDVLNALLFVLVELEVLGLTFTRPNSRAFLRSRKFLLKSMRRVDSEHNRTSGKNANQAVFVSGGETTLGYCACPATLV